MGRRLLLLQLVVPGFLLWIGADAYRHGFQGRFAIALIGAGSVWIAAGLVLFLVGSRPGMADWISRTNLLSFSAVFCFLILEAAISIAVPICRFGISRFPRPPNLRLEFRNNTDAIPGRAINTVFSTNDLGLRGSPQSASEGAYKVMAVGASTTLEFRLDDSAAWPHLLEKRLEQDRSGRAWVQNAGVSGHTATEHLLMLRSSPVTTGSDLVLILAGVNDLSAALAFEGRSSEADVSLRSREEFGLFPLHSRSATYKLFKLLTGSSTNRQDWADFYSSRRARRRASRSVAIPSLDIGVREYGERIRRLVNECTTRGKRCVFMTQPTIWKDDMAAGESDSLWLGWVGLQQRPIGYASAADLGAAMRRFNAETVKIVNGAHFEVYDLAAHVPKTSVMFYDDCHFTNSGSASVAQGVADYLKQSRR